MGSIYTPCNRSLFSGVLARISYSLMPLGSPLFQIESHTGDWWNAFRVALRSLYIVWQKHLIMLVDHLQATHWCLTVIHSPCSLKKIPNMTASPVDKYVVKFLHSEPVWKRQRCQVDSRRNNQWMDKETRLRLVRHRAVSKEPWCASDASLPFRLVLSPVGDHMRLCRSWEDHERAWNDYQMLPEFTIGTCERILIQIKKYQSPRIGVLMDSWREGWGDIHDSAAAYMSKLSPKPCIIRIES